MDKYFAGTGCNQLKLARNLLYLSVIYKANIKCNFPWIIFVYFSRNSVMITKMRDKVFKNEPNEICGDNL